MGKIKSFLNKSRNGFIEDKFVNERESICKMGLSKSVHEYFLK